MTAFRPNLETKGRLFRAAGAMGLLGGAGLLWKHSAGAGVLVGVLGGVVAFEAIRGWCVLRACGLKTRF
jgi:hypothetical protein